MIISPLHAIFRRRPHQFHCGQCGTRIKSPTELGGWQFCSAKCAEEAQAEDIERELFREAGRDWRRK